MLRITLDNVRTFAKPTEVEIRPLTILTGENSSGKTAFLAIAAAVCDPVGFPFAPGFNRPPFGLGSFDTIATSEGPERFSIGYASDSSANRFPRSVRATYGKISGQPELIRFEASRGQITVIIDAGRSDRDHFAGTLTLKGLGEPSPTATFNLPRRMGEDRHPSLADLILATARSETEAILWSFMSAPELEWTSFAPSASIAIAPVRSQPQRTYDQPADQFTAGGERVPFILDRLLREKGATPESAAVLSALDRFGADSGLFARLNVRKFGDRPEDPFQILVSIGGREINLVDVGYGVSQSLPIIVESVLAPLHDLVLLQQPEVHLHPQAQAALGTFFSGLARDTNKHFLIETHSDHLVDRIRQEVSAGRIAPEKVQILYFERSGLESKIHALKLDRMANILGAPPNYRAFFLEEDLRLLGLK